MLERAGLLVALAVVAWGCAAVQPPAPVAVRNLTFTSSWTATGKAPLVDGEYRERQGPGSAARLVVKLVAAVFGAIGGREVGAVILATDPGGSGSFYDLALVVRRDGRWENTDVVALGDRVKIGTPRVENDAVIVPMLTHGPRDAMCCPTQPMTRRFAVQHDRLVSLAGRTTTPIARRGAPGPPAVGRRSHLTAGPCLVGFGVLSPPGGAFMDRLTHPTLLLSIALLTGACATSEEWADWKGNTSHFASGQHGWFSLANQKDQKRVTRADVEAARAESWWGRPVTVSSDQIIER